ncbi:MAG: DUF1800 family protein [Acidobacteria bacterium]|nr:DUF1800 family protein [Acidobacteriota bacterium]
MNFSNLRCLRRTVAVSTAILLFTIFVATNTAQQQPNRSPIAPLRYPVPSGPLSAGEKIIPLPNSGKAEILNEEQRILHILNRAGFGPRPGDVERIRRMGLDRYLDEQLNPEQMSEDFLSRPLMALNTLHSEHPRNHSDVFAFHTNTDSNPDASACSRNSRSAEGRRHCGNRRRQVRGYAETGDERSCRFRTRAAGDETAGEHSAKHEAGSGAETRSATAASGITAGKIAESRVQRKTAPGGDGRFLVQPFQRLRSEKSDTVDGHIIRT